MVSAMRRDDGCDARLACRLGGLARESALFSQADNRKMILGAINQVREITKPIIKIDFYSTATSRFFHLHFT